MSPNWGPCKKKCAVPRVWEGPFLFGQSPECSREGLPLTTINHHHPFLKLSRRAPDRISHTLSLDSPSLSSTLPICPIRHLTTPSVGISILSNFTYFSYRTNPSKEALPFLQEGCTGGTLQLSEQRKQLRFQQ